MPRFILSFILASISASAVFAAPLEVRHDTGEHKIQVYRRGSDQPILTQNARPDFRPYVHPIVAPDGRGLITEYNPDDRPHQTGLYWGFTSVNGRDYFHRPYEDYWRRVSASVVKAASTDTDPNVRWQTVYDLLDARGEAVLRETQVWAMREETNDDEASSYVLELEWSGTAKRHVTIGEFDYGGMFLRMPWEEGMNTRARNSIRLENERAEGQRAVWLDLGMQIEGRDDQVHVAIFDHAKNPGYPTPWRVDGAFGVGPVLARLGDWKIPKGETAVFRHQLRVYTGELDEVALTAKWSEFATPRRGISYSEWDLAELDQYAGWHLADVLTVEEAHRSEFLSPEKAVAAMTVADGFDVNVFASEPMISQPMAFCWDDRGRLWIAQNKEYRGIGGGLELTGESRILILEDTDRDGRADSRKVFLEDVAFPSAIAVGFGGLWLGSIPNLLFVPDRDGDDRADVDDIEVRLTGWGAEDLHEIVNSFIWGPDGWLYGLQGVFTPSEVGKPAGKSRVYEFGAPYPEEFEYDGEPVEINGGVWRYHPSRDRFEVVAHGFSNPWGVDYDAKGQLFLSACVIPHLWHAIPGGVFLRQSGSHYSSHVYSDIRTIGDHRHRSAHGGARVYLSDAFPEEYRGRLFMGNIHEHAVLTDVLERRGSGFVGRHGDDFLQAGNAQFIGFSMEIGPDGGVYVLDWHDAEICGGAPRTRDTGRVYRILPSESRAKQWKGRYSDLAAMSNLELVLLQLSASAWHARRARVLLQQRAVEGAVGRETHAALRRMFDTNDSGDYRLRALWALHVTGGIDETGLLAALGDSDAYIRAWAVQLLCEDKSPGEVALDRFAQMAVTDSSPVVRLYLASALQRMPRAELWPIARQLVLRGEDADDHNIPKIIWFGIEAAVAADPARGLDIARRSRIPMLTRHIARRLTAADHLAKLVEEIESERGSRQLLLLGMQDGLEGLEDVEAPENWASVYRELRADAATADLALEISLSFGDALAADVLLGTLRDEQSSLQDRRRALRGLSGRRRPELAPLLSALVDDDAMRTDAIRAVASFGGTALARELLHRYSTFSARDKLEVVHALASRSSSGWELAQAIGRGAVPRRDVPNYLARVLHRTVGNRFLDIWGPVEGLSLEREAAMARYRTLLTGDALAKGNPRPGREVFQRTCGSCHQMYGEGGRVGPDLTGANRTDLNYLLGNILTPSAVVHDDYRMTLVFTDDGQLYSGVLENESDRHIRLRVANVDEPVTIANSRILRRELTEQSMMPEGLLDQLQDSEVIDLFSYLGSLDGTTVTSVFVPTHANAERVFLLEKKYLNLPVRNDAPEVLLSFAVDGKKVREFDIQLADGEPDYWLYLEVDEFAGKTGTLKGRKLSQDQLKRFEAIHHADTFPGEESLYKERLRPQFHFSSKRGWNNDPNGLVYYKGEYHLFYQHNPFGWSWNNMTWGHAISRDLVHWTEMGDALHQDEWGMMFSGSGIVDWHNTTGLQEADEPPLILIYTNAGGDNEWSTGKPFTQGIAYSNDRGRTWTKYDGNPVQGHLRKANRDPKVIWWEEAREWVIVMYLREGRIAFFRTPDLKRWELQSVIEGFHECPELFQLAVDGDEDNKKWILNGAHGEYFLGSFDGTDYRPETEGIRYNYGNCFYASQTWSDIPEEDGRRIQIAWGRVNLPDMPFNQMMTFPVSLSLRSTGEGLRMFAYPVEEIEKLHGREWAWMNEKVEPGKNLLRDVEGNLFDIDAEIALGDADEVGFVINGFDVSYDVKTRMLSAGGNELSGEDEEFGSKPGGELAPIDGRIRLRILVDRPSVEIFGNDGRVYMPMQAVRDLDDKSLSVYAKGGSARIVKLAVREVNSIWQ